MWRAETHVPIDLCLKISELKNNILMQLDEILRGDWFSWIVGYSL